MARTGLEWLHRLAQEPSRLWRRYLVDNPRALPVFLGMALSRARGRPLHRRCRVETSPLRAEPFPPAAITHASRVPSPSVASTRRARVT